MKRIALATLFAAAAAASAQAEVFVDQARVRSVEPQYETVQVPREACTSHWVRDAQPVAGPNIGGAVIGGVAGAAVGRQFGGGSGRDAATVAGAVVGAMAGNHIANSGRPPSYEEAPREVRSCHTVMEPQSRLAGYRVHYEYRGQHFTTLTREHPGATLAVRVSVAPVEREYHRR